MKKNRMMRLASILLVCVLLTTSVISGTFAKYISDATGTDTARVAKWSFKVGSGDTIADIATTNTTTFTFDLFKTINDTNGSAESDISPADGSIIAPGTQGSFEIVLTNASEVTAKYAIDYTVTKSDDTLPIKFSVNGGTTWTDDLTDVAASENAEDGSSTVLAVGSTAKTIKVQWKWEFTGNDGVDTALGVAAAAATDENPAPNVTVSAKVTATQVD